MPPSGSTALMWVVEPTGERGGRLRAAPGRAGPEPLQEALLAEVADEVGVPQARWRAAPRGPPRGSAPRRPAAAARPRSAARAAAISTPARGRRRVGEHGRGRGSRSSSGAPLDHGVVAQVLPGHAARPRPTRPSTTAWRAAPSRIVPGAPRADLLQRVGQVGQAQPVARAQQAAARGVDGRRAGARGQHARPGSRAGTRPARLSTTPSRASARGRRGQVGERQAARAGPRPRPGPATIPGTATEAGPMWKTWLESPKGTVNDHIRAGSGGPPAPRPGTATKKSSSTAGPPGRPGEQEAAGARGR